jgi:protein TonB
MADKIVDMMKNSPKWKPAIQNGRPVRSYHTQPITLVIVSEKDPSKT